MKPGSDGVHLLRLLLVVVLLFFHPRPSFSAAAADFPSQHSPWIDLDAPELERRAFPQEIVDVEDPCVRKACIWESAKQLLDPDTLLGFLNEWFTADRGIPSSSPGPDRHFPVDLGWKSEAEEEEEGEDEAEETVILDPEAPAFLIFKFSDTETADNFTAEFRYREDDLHHGESADFGLQLLFLDEEGLEVLLSRPPEAAAAAAAVRPIEDYALKGSILRSNASVPVWRTESRLERRINPFYAVFRNSHPAEPVVFSYRLSYKVAGCLEFFFITLALPTVVLLGLYFLFRHYRKHRRLEEESTGEAIPPPTAVNQSNSRTPLLAAGTQQKSTVTSSGALLEDPGAETGADGRKVTDDMDDMDEEDRILAGVSVSSPRTPLYSPARGGTGQRGMSLSERRGSMLGLDSEDSGEEDRVGGGREGVEDITAGICLPWCIHDLKKIRPEPGRLTRKRRPEGPSFRPYSGGIHLPDVRWILGYPAAFYRRPKVNWCLFWRQNLLWTWPWNPERDESLLLFHHRFGYLCALLTFNLLSLTVWSDLILGWNKGLASTPFIGGFVLKYFGSAAFQILFNLMVKPITVFLLYKAPTLFLGDPRPLVRIARCILRYGTQILAFCLLLFVGGAVYNFLQSYRCRVMLEGVLQPFLIFEIVKSVNVLGVIPLPIWYWLRCVFGPDHSDVPLPAEKPDLYLYQDDLSDGTRIAGMSLATQQSGVYPRDFVISESEDEDGSGFPGQQRLASDSDSDHENV